MFRVVIHEKGDPCARKPWLQTAMLLVLMLAVSPAAAVTDGELDGNGHPMWG